MSSITAYNAKGMALLPSLYSGRGGWNNKSGMDKITEDIRILLMTRKGTLIGDPDFGCNIYQLLYQGNNNTTASLVRYEVKTAIEKYISEVSITSMDVIFDKNTMELNIKYTISNTNIGSSMTLNYIKGGE